MLGLTLIKPIITLWLLEIYVKIVTLRHVAGSQNSYQYNPALTFVNRNSCEPDALPWNECSNFCNAERKV